MLDSIAAVHAFSLKNTDWLGNDKLTATYQRDFIRGARLDILPKIFDELKANYSTMLDPPLIDRLTAAAADMDMRDVTELVEEMNVPPVMVHGDLTPGNLLWAKNKEENVEELKAIIDWQVFWIDKISIVLSGGVIFQSASGLN